MHLALYLTLSGLHLGAWRHPKARIDNPMDIGAWLSLARSAEDACLDMVFMADKLGIDGIYGGSIDATVRTRAIGGPDPLTLITGLSVLTSRIGVAATVSTTYSEPYHTARAIGSINHFSQGRAGWNAVTSVSDSEARNFGRDRHLAHDERYERAGEFIQAVAALWSSWEDDALCRDQVAGVYANPSKIRAVNYCGDFIRTSGPLTQPPFSSSAPVLIQAGVSDKFINVAARYADVIFPVLSGIQRARQFVVNYRNAVALGGRNSDAVRILPGCVPIVAETDAAAQALRGELDALITTTAGLTFMSASMNTDLARYQASELTPDLDEEIGGSRGRFLPLIADARARGLTLGEFAREYASSLSFPIFAGSPVTVADEMIRWVEESGVDGFVVLPAYQLAGQDLFLTAVIPELQRRGAFRTAYKGTTLRDHLRLGSGPINSLN